MISTIIGTICAIVLGFNLAKLKHDKTYTALILIDILLVVMIACGIISGYTAEENLPIWIKIIGGFMGIYAPMYATEKITDAYYQKKSPKIFYLLTAIFIIICIAIYALGYCGFSGLLYTFAGLIILGVALIIEIFGTFGILIAKMFKK